jgi:hypothetical protein
MLTGMKTTLMTPKINLETEYDSEVQHSVWLQSESLFKQMTACSVIFYCIISHVFHAASINIYNIDTCEYCQLQFIRREL